MPRDVDGVLAAGRNLSADTKSHAALREIPECWVMGEAAGVAAVMAVNGRHRLRDVSVPELQRRLQEGAPSSSRRVGSPSAFRTTSTRRLKPRFTGARWTTPARTTEAGQQGELK